ncbi:MAG: MerR family DNA-binding transcriptional regulator [Thomasclavelia sp.]|uniref:MerR family DNA-binding transcriptional regulator n=1 Tax=Thomasclavelia sp. TaxID=3025757 RepID=UPI002630971B|nr:MerR family DNA-binding transcriptional regulator [Thomasclavelia sp.]
MSYTIGEIAKMLNVSPSTIRYYDKEGLLPFVERTKGGIRIFKDKDYEFLKIIHCLKKNRNADKRYS